MNPKERFHIVVGVVIDREFLKQVKISWRLCNQKPEKEGIMFDNWCILQ